MITTEAIKEILQNKLSGADIAVNDLTGTQDHFEVQVRWTGFEGKSLIEQHQVINKALADKIEDGSIHALKIKTIAAASENDSAQADSGGFNILN